MKNKTGFTLIELLVTISIITLLSSVILATVRSVRERAMYTRAEVEISEFIKMAIIAQGETGKTIIEITGSGCSQCVCRTGLDLRGDTGDCYNNWTSALTLIQNATNNTVSGLDRMTRDPWGSPYQLDQNEREGSPDNCTRDSIGTVGPDGIWNTSDDKNYSVPWHDTCP